MAQGPKFLCSRKFMEMETPKAVDKKWKSAMSNLKAHHFLRLAEDRKETVGRGSNTGRWISNEQTKQRFDRNIRRKRNW